MKSTLHKDIRAKMRVDTYSNFQQQQAYYPLSRSIVFRNLYEWLYFSQYISVLHQKASINIIRHLYGKIRHTYSKERRITRKSDKFFRRTKFVPKTINFGTFAQQRIVRWSRRNNAFVSKIGSTDIPLWYSKPYRCQGSLGKHLLTMYLEIIWIF